jgi:hypothetical protein
MRMYLGSARRSSGKSGCSAGKGIRRMRKEMVPNLSFVFFVFEGGGVGSRDETLIIRK